ncbi:putative ABC transport system permease protein [Gemmobacter megaterium]|uniref:Putative ABC transport system permease protein n=1 Tax=Gemmobacter megaterium TaxID=1086013 RepID=A0A1N7KAZ4_9RHOB|nr:FtsX-like permease family protein [Gemmobacter megaterium]SIS58680.1 putative ABC transport system permease protein [Gemmobacter megaterium]
MAAGQGLGLAIRLARRELRGGLKGFRVFLACLVLGVAAIAAVGIVRSAIQHGLADQGAVLLGGDAQMKFTYRFATEEERAFMDRVAVRVAEVVDFRSMVVVGDGAAAERGLTQVKAVDAGWPLLGRAEMDPPMTVAQALAGADGLPGAVMDGVLMDRLGLAVGDTFRLGLTRFHLSARLLREPDSASGGFGLGPRTLVRSADLAESGLIGPGTLYETEYRMTLPETADLAAIKAEALAQFRDTGMRWQDRTRAAPGVERFVTQMGAFLVLVGLAGLAVGGVGISAAVRAYLDGKTATIATLRTLGASQGLLFRTYLVQIGLLTLLGVVLGLLLGVGVPLMAAPVINAVLPVPAVFAPYPLPMLEAAFYGVTVSLLFTVWPLARASSTRAAALYRAAGGRVAGWPAPVWWGVTGGLAALLVGGAMVFSGAALMALWAAVGVAGALLVLMLAAQGLKHSARWLARSRLMRGRPALRLAVSAVGGPGHETASVVLSLGLGLTVLAAVGQIDGNLRSAIARDLPERAPAYFFVDIQNDQIAGFLDRLTADPAVDRVETAPMLRGVLTRINGRPASEVAGDHWVVRGDRGVTYADQPPEGTKVVAGEWWPPGYDGPPQVSFGLDEAQEIGLKLGDRITVNILGRDIEVTITSFREVDFSTGGIGFVMSLSPNAVQGAPHTHIATVYTAQEHEARILRDLAQAYPNVTAIRIRDAVAQVTDALDAIATATAWAAGATLLTGFMVLIGAAAAGERSRVFESAVLKTLGATRGRILASFALRSALMGAAAGAVAVLAGGLAGWAVMRLVMEVPYRFEPVSALAIVVGGIFAVMVAGLLFALRPLAARPARILRAQD